MTARLWANALPQYLKVVIFPEVAGLSEDFPAASGIVAKGIAVALFLRKEASDVLRRPCKKTCQIDVVGTYLLYARLDKY